MDYNQIMNGGLLYALVIAGLLFIIGFIIVTFRRAWANAQKLGISREKLMLVIRSSALFTIVPSISIVIGVFSLSAVLGVPWAWFRLSVLGSLNYELTSAGMIASSSGYDSLAALSASGETGLIGAIMITMSLCILPGVIVLIFCGKQIQSSLMKVESKSPEVGSLLIACCLLALVAVFGPSMVLGNAVKTATFITSAVIAAIHLVLIKKCNMKWLANFTLADTLVLSMVCSVFWNNLLAK